MQNNCIWGGRGRKLVEEGGRERKTFLEKDQQQVTGHDTFPCFLDSFRSRPSLQPAPLTFSQLSDPFLTSFKSHLFVAVHL